MKKTDSAYLNSLRRAVFDLHESDSTWIKSVQVKEMSGDAVVWEGAVEVFKLKGHPTAKTAYAWSHPIEGSTKHKFYVVLGLPPIDSPVKAVRAAILQDSRNSHR